MKITKILGVWKKFKVGTEVKVIDETEVHDWNDDVYNGKVGVIKEIKRNGRTAVVDFGDDGEYVVNTIGLSRAEENDSTKYKLLFE